MKLELYKVRNKQTGLFSKGGVYCDSTYSGYWSKKGKVWTSAGAMRRHLFQYTYEVDKVNVPKHVLSGWEVIHYFTGEDGRIVEQTYNAKDFYEKKHLELV